MSNITREEAIQVLETALTAPFIYGEYADAIDMAIEALLEPINCVKCKHYYETEEDGGIEGHCRMDTAHTSLSSADAMNQRWDTCFACPLSRRCPKIQGASNEDAEKYASEIPKDCPIETKLPSADRPQGEWTYLSGSRGSYMTISCPICGSTFDDVAEWKYHFCPNCGADMKGKKNEYTDK